MMKKILFILFTLTICIFMVNFSKPNVKADSTNKGELVSTKTEVLEDGSYLVTNLYLDVTSNSARLSYTKNHCKTVTHYSTTDDVLWIYELYGYFTIVEGERCTATYSRYETAIYGSGWSFSDGASSVSDNQAFGQGTFKYKLLGITVKTFVMDLTITCDEYGNIS